jgi:hypothetical protein
VECSVGPIEAEISGGRSHYKGLLMKLDKRFSHRTTATLAYAYADQVGYNGLIDNSNWLRKLGSASRSSDANRIDRGVPALGHPGVGHQSSFQSAAPSSRS